ncbi:uncharacterized protein TNCV_2047371 [Trichonephila clavipes]|uniref:Uncharacterized protein n=1 Tax=Trichonephila clavipes TaxID=2585209 RepID=A0A8X6SU77_TRICX|nr:uncharacterized protein TNCV_2047371 [Trichonephila clavipes]
MLPPLFGDRGGFNRMENYLIIECDYLGRAFPNRWIERGGPVACSPRSPDLSPLDFFPWGAMNSLVYDTPVNSEMNLVAQISIAVVTIRETPSIFEHSCHFWEKEKKADLLKLAIELGECKSNGEEQKIIELRTKILTNDAYKEDPEFVKCIFERIVSNRIDEENKRKSKHCVNLSCRKYDLQNKTQRVVGPQTLPQTEIELKKMLPTFNPEVDNMDLFLTLFERQLKLLDLGEDLWVPYLIGALPSDVTSLIAHEPEEKCRDYSHIQGMLLQWFKLTAEKFRELFSRHRKSPNGTWKDYYFEIRAYFEGWLNELKIPLTD